MQTSHVQRRIAVFLLTGALACSVWAGLPPPTAEQAQAAAAKKQQAAAQAAREKQELAAAMDTIAARWRGRAAANGWDVHPATPVDAPQGFTASELQSGASGQPGGRRGSETINMPVRSEKYGTAADSKDVKDPAKKGK